MDYRKVTEDISIAGQPTLEDIKALAAEGFKSIMINRPDGEEPGQPSHAEEKAAAESVGMAFAAVPLAPGQLTRQLVSEFKAAYDALPKPVLAHCKGGPRSVTLWALSQVGEMSAEEIIKTGAEAGFDLRNLGPALMPENCDCDDPNCN